MKKIILASQSPRRKTLLTAMGVEFETIPSKFEEQLDESRNPIEVAKELSLGKARDVAKDHPDAYVIGSDAIVWFDNKQLEKPTSHENAHELLKMLSGRTHYVTSGLAIVCLNDGVELVDADTTEVAFKPYDEKVISEYVATGDPMDKAGGYGIQSGGDVLVERINGETDTIVGFPTKLLAQMLNKCGIEARSAAGIVRPFA